MSEYILSIPSEVITHDHLLTAIDVTQSFQQDISRNIYRKLTSLANETNYALTLVPPYGMQYDYETWAARIASFVDTPHIVNSPISEYYAADASDNKLLYIENFNKTRVQPQAGYAGLPVAIVVRSGPTKFDPIVAKWEVRHAPSLNPAPVYPRMNEFVAAYMKFRLMWQILAITHLNMPTATLASYDTYVENSQLRVMDGTATEFNRRMRFLSDSIYNWYFINGYSADIVTGDQYVLQADTFALLGINPGYTISNQALRDELQNTIRSSAPSASSIPAYVTTQQIPNTDSLLPYIYIYQSNYNSTNDPNIASFNAYRTYLQVYAAQQMLAVGLGNSLILNPLLEAVTIVANTERDTFNGAIKSLQAVFRNYFVAVLQFTQNATDILTVMDVVVISAAPSFNAGYYYRNTDNTGALLSNYNQGYNDINIRRYETYRLIYYNAAKALVTSGNTWPIIFYSPIIGFDVCVPNDPPPQGASEYDVTRHLNALAAALLNWFTARGFALNGIAAANDKNNYAYIDTNIYNYQQYRNFWLTAATSYGTAEDSAECVLIVINDPPPAQCTEQVFLRHINNLQARYIRWLYRYTTYSGDKQAIINTMVLTAPEYIPLTTDRIIDLYGATAPSTRKTVIPKNTLGYAIEYNNNVATYGSDTTVTLQTTPHTITMSIPNQLTELQNNTRYMSTIELNSDTSTLIAGDPVALASYRLGGLPGEDPYIYATIAPSLGVSCTVSYDGKQFIADYTYTLATAPYEDRDFIDANLAVYDDNGVFLGKAYADFAGVNGPIGTSLKGTHCTFKNVQTPNGLFEELVTLGTTRTLQFVFTPIYYIAATDPSIGLTETTAPLLQLEPMPVDTITVTGTHTYTDVSLSLVETTCNSVTVSYTASSDYMSAHIGVFDASSDTFLGWTWDPVANSATITTSPTTIRAYRSGTQAITGSNYTATNYTATIDGDIYYLMPAVEYSFKYVGVLSTSNEARDIMENTSRLTVMTQQLDISAISVESSSITVGYNIAGYTNTLIRIYNDQEQYIGDAVVNSDTTVTGSPATITEYVSTVGDPIQPIQPLTTYWLAPVPLDPTGTPIYPENPSPAVKIMISTPIPPIVDGMCHCTTAFTAVDLTNIPTPPDPTAAVTGSNPALEAAYGPNATILDASSIRFENGVGGAKTVTNLNGANGFIFKCTIPSFANPYPQGAGTSALRIRIGDLNIDTGKGGNPSIEINFDPNCNNYAIVTPSEFYSDELCDIGGLGGETLTVIHSSSYIYLFMGTELRGAGVMGASTNGWNLSFVGQTSQYYPTTAFTLSDIVFVEVTPIVDPGVCVIMGTNQVDLTGLGTPPDPLATYTGVNPPFDYMYWNNPITTDSFIFNQSASEIVYNTTAVAGTGFFFQCTIPTFVDPYPQPRDTKVMNIVLFGGVYGTNDSLATCSIVFDPNCQNYMDIMPGNTITPLSHILTYNIGGVAGDTLTVIADGSSIFLFINGVLRGAGEFPSANIGWGCRVYGSPNYNQPASHFTVDNVKFYPYERPQQPPQPPVPCLVEGTRILTPAGYRPVENLRRGDKVITADGRLVSARLYRTCVQRTTPETAPYRIPPGLFVGQREELLLSPMHAFQVRRGIWEIPKYAAARYPQIRQVCIGEAVNYYHVELPDFFHDNLVINGGAVTESYGRNQCRGLPADFCLYRYSAKKGGFIRALQPQPQKAGKHA